VDQDRKRAHYLGTEIDEKWWRRYRREGLFARGLGRYWLEDGRLEFRRLLHHCPFAIPLAGVVEHKLGSWHAGRWAAGAPVVKIIWKHEGQRLSSGFVFSRDRDESLKIIQELRAAGRKPAA
jgi:hypothetical protein